MAVVNVRDPPWNPPLTFANPVSVQVIWACAFGATAAHSLFGKAMAIGKNRGAALLLPDGSECWITVHPSFLLRIPEEDRKREERALFVRDLKHIKARAEELAI